MGKGGGRNASATAKEALQAQLDEMSEYAGTLTDFTMRSTHGQVGIIARSWLSSEEEREMPLKGDL
jgi:hypothetical protein